MARIIGIRHRTKQTAEGEDRPTQVVILKEDGERVAIYDLTDEQAELDFVRGQVAVNFRPVTDTDDINRYPESHLKLKKLKDTDTVPESLIKQTGKDRFHVTHVADIFDGLQHNDRVAMSLGGSGDYFAFALARKGQEIGASVYRIPPAKLKELRGNESKDHDAGLLGQYLLRTPARFNVFEARDAEVIMIREAYRARIDAMKERIACDQRLRQRFIGAVFCRPDGYFPEGAIEKQFDNMKANSSMFAILSKDEARCERELEKLVKSSGVWQHVLGGVEGLGWAIASRIIASVVDIRRFKSKNAFKAFSGVHILADGRFARRRSNQVSNWSPDVRQALYLLGDQFNRRPSSYWGQKLLANKAHFRTMHPEVVVAEKGTKRYTNGHIHKMATWRTLTQFAMWLYREWSRYEQDPERFTLNPYYPSVQQVKNTSA